MAIGESQVDVHGVCCSSRYFELRAMLSEAQDLINGEDVDGKAMSVEFTKFVNTFGPVSSALLQIVEGCLCLLKSDGCCI